MISRYLQIGGLPTCGHAGRGGSSTAYSESVKAFGKRRPLQANCLWTDSAEFNAGFYAAAYTIGGDISGLAGKTVISYRGTDNLSLNPFGASDIFNGWISAVGLPPSQASLAYRFYNSVRSTPTQAITYNNGTQSNVILTGHSLGGGLPFRVAALSGTEALIFDQMPFGTIAAEIYA